MAGVGDGVDPVSAAGSDLVVGVPGVGSRRGRLGVEDLGRAAAAAADLDDPEVMDCAWR